MNERLLFLFDERELSRIQISVLADGKRLITVDMHGLKPREAERFLKNLIALNREGYEMCVIHGFNHGTVIKNMVNKDELGSRVVGRLPVKHNPGRTRLMLRAA